MFVSLKRDTSVLVSVNELKIVFNTLKRDTLLVLNKVGKFTSAPVRSRTVRVVFFIVN